MSTFGSKGEKKVGKNKTKAKKRGGFRGLFADKEIDYTQSAPAERDEGTGYGGAGGHSGGRVRGKGGDRERVRERGGRNKSDGGRGASKNVAEDIRSERSKTRNQQKQQNVPGKLPGDSNDLRSLLNGQLRGQQGQLKKSQEQQSKRALNLQQGAVELSDRPHIAFGQAELRLARAKLKEGAEMRDYSDPLRAAMRMVAGRRFKGSRGVLQRWSDTPAVPARSKSKKAPKPSGGHWKQCYCVLTAESLDIYSSQEQYPKAPLRKMLLNDFDINVVLQDDLTFLVSNGQMTERFKAESENVRDTWTGLIRGEIDTALTDEDAMRNGIITTTRTVVDTAKPQAMLPDTLRAVALEEYAKAVREGGAKPWMRSKLMFVGEGRVGKTATVRSLLGMPFDPNLASTVGADATKTCVVDRKERVVNWQEKIGMEGREYDQMVAQFVAQKLEVVTTEDVLNATEDEKDDSFWFTEDSETGEIVDTRKATDKNKKKKKSIKLRAVGEEEDNDDESDESDSDEFGDLNDALANQPTPGGQDTARKFDEQLVLESLKNGDAVTFSMWDFGGQRVFYALHHVFLTRYGAYCCLFNMTDLVGKSATPDNKKRALMYLTFWLNSVKMHADGAPFFLIGTHKDAIGSVEEHKAVDRILKKELSLDWVGNLVSNETEDLMFFPIDNSVGASRDLTIQHIRTKIDEAVKEDGYVQKQVPIKWMKALDALHSESKDHMELERVLEICAETGIDNKEAFAMLELFHELGVLLYFQSSPELRNIIVLEPQFLIDAIGIVIRERTLHEDSALFRHDARGRRLAKDYQRLLDDAIVSDRLLDFLWRDQDEEGAKPVNRNFLKAIMEDMTLLCQWSSAKGGGKKEYLIPSLLPDASNAFAESFLTTGTAISPSAATFYFDFSSFFLPNGLFERLVCLAVTHSLTAFSNATREPELTQQSAFLSFGMADFKMQTLPAKRRIVVVVFNKEDAAMVRIQLTSMMEKLREEVMHDRLKYKVVVLGDSSMARKKSLSGMGQMLSRKSGSENKQTFEADIDTVSACRKSKEMRVRSISGKVLDITMFSMWYPQRKGDAGNGQVIETGDGEVAFAGDSKPLPEGKKYHFFLSHFQSNGGDQAQALDLQLAMKGYKVWYDNEQAKVTKDDMLDGVAESCCLVLFLTKGVLTRPFVQLEIVEALKNRQPILMIHEQDRRKDGFAEIYELRDESPPQFSVLFQDIECIPYRRRAYEVVAMVHELDRRMLEPLPKSIVKILDADERQFLSGLAGMDSVAHVAGDQRLHEPPTPDEATAMVPITRRHSPTRPAMRHSFSTADIPRDAGSSTGEMVDWIKGIEGLSLTSDKVARLADRLVGSGYDCLESVRDLSTEDIRAFGGSHLDAAGLDAIMYEVMMEFLKSVPALIPDELASEYTSTLKKNNLGCPAMLVLRLNKEKRQDSKAKLLLGMKFKHGHVKRVLRACESW